MIKPRQIRYDPRETAPTIAQFHRSKAFHRGIRGPRGSAKSTGCCWESQKIMRKQAPNPQDKIRRTRGVVVRNTYRQLKDTAIKTWLHWFGPRNGMPKVKESDMTWTFKGGDIEAEVLFRALDSPQDVDKLLSLELTWAWVNEAREIPKGIIDGLDDCVGRYPSPADGGPTWYGIFMDTNSMDDTHWWPKLEADPPHGWEFFTQPGGLIEVSDGEFVPNPAAENLANLVGGADWYTMRVGGKSKDHIRIYYCNKFGFVVDGRPVIPEYIDSIHCPGEILQPIPGHPIYVGIDFGLTPSSIFAQRAPNGQWRWIDEIVSESIGIKRFAEIELKPKIQGEYRGFDFIIDGDPAGKQRAQTDEQTCFDLLRAAGIPAEPAPTNDFTIRRDVIADALGRLIDGKPGLIISPKCKIARKGLMGGYCYKQKQVAISGGEVQYKDFPEKNRYSHPVEAGGYAMLGAGEGYNLISRPSDGLDDPNDVIQPPTPWAA